MHVHRRVGRGALVAALVAGGLALAPLAGSAAAADPVTLNLLNINDFHGRIDTNTVKFAGTIEQLRAAGGEANTLFLAAGDNVSASLFASAVADDQPTIDVLNALGLQASAVGNHEFDKGYDDLIGRIINGGKNATWAYLGANVYQKGTTTPALPEYQTFTVDGLKVAVIGAVTQETPSLVSPGGITQLDIGDPVQAVNRVVGELSDGNAANGEADVFLAEYHEGASEGTPDGATFDQELAAGGPFAEIVNDTSPKVAAIFTGHTHKEYAWDAPIPGVAGKTRPVLQTGDYGANIGNVKLTVDPASKAVLSYTAVNVPQTTVDDATLVATYPRVAAVQTITNAALAYATQVGGQTIGAVSADVTTAFLGGSYVNGVYTAGATGTRDDRSKESTLGDLVADALLSTLQPADLGGAEIGVVNPGGLRAELLYAPDGAVTYAEANSVLPFVNNLWTVSLTGAQVKTMLEQQWQTNADGTIPSRPYLQLGLSKNITYTFDSTRAQGDHITSVTVNGAALDPAKSYRIGTFSFLTTGGDNFRIFTSGADAKDSGLVDRDGWIQYLKDHNPVTPDFARQAVEVSGAPTTVQAGSTVAFAVKGLDLTSLGSPANTTLAVKLGAATLGTVAVADGAAAVSVVIPATAAAGAGALTLVAAPSGTTVTLPLTITAKPKAATRTTLAAHPSTQVYGYPHRVTLVATVAAGDGSVVTGDVQFRLGNHVLGTAKVVHGRASFTLPARTPAGQLKVTAVYRGSGSLLSSTSSAVTVVVLKAPSVTLLGTSAAVQQYGARSAVLFAAPIVPVVGASGGRIVFHDGSRVVATVALHGGYATYTLPSKTWVGVHRLFATYLPANSNIARSTSNVTTVTVRK